MAGNITFLNNSATVREGGIYTSQSVDLGKTFYYSLGTLGIKQLTANARTTVPSFGLVTVPSGSKI